MTTTGELPDIDADSPPLKSALSRLCNIIAGQLEKAGEAIESGQCGAWQACGFMHRLDKLRVETEFLVKEAKRLKPVDESNETPAF